MISTIDTAWRLEQHRRWGALRRRPQLDRECLATFHEGLSQALIRQITGLTNCVR
jgi:hypothetical protein